MIDRLLDETEWPGREVRPTGGDASDEASEESSQEALSRPQDLMSPDQGQAVAERLSRAEGAVERLEQDAARLLDENLDLDTGSLPQTEEAVKYLTGRHPDFGTDYPEVPDEEKLNDDARLTGPVVRRAYDVMESADRNAFGVDLQEAVLSDEVRPFDDIQSPGQAAGDVDPGRKEEMGLPEVFEKKTKERRISMAKKAAYLVGGILLKFVAQIVESIADKIKGALSIGIGPYSVGIGKYIAKPLYWFADLLRQWAEDLMAKGLGTDPTDRPVPEKTSDVRSSTSDEDGGFPDSLRPDSDSYPDGISDLPDAAGDYGGDAGQDFLMAAQQALRTAEAEAHSREDPALARGLSAFDKARVLKRDLNAHREIATAWGAPRSAESPQPEQPADPAPVTPETGGFDDC